VSITWDREGVRFKKGLAVSADGRMVAQRNDLGRVTGRV
jgi:hypothetical protein